MSPKKPHGLTCSSPAITHSRATSTSFFFSGVVSPMMNMREESE